MQLARRPYILIVLDGWGYSENTIYNAIHSAKKPNWDRLWSEYPHILINASGLEVGLPDTQMGNSEVGHMNIGSGRVVAQDITRISQAIDDGSFFKNPALCSAFEQAAKNNKAVHILGLLSPGGVHSHQDHISALMQLCSQCNVEHIYLHAFLDGRDTPPKSAEEYLHDVQLKMLELGKGQFASIVGRYFAMDRNKHWDRTKAAYDLICDGQAEFQSDDAFIAVDMAYSRGETDEFVKPTAIVGHGKKPVRVNDGDVMVFANFRSDRARQLAQAFTDPDFAQFERNRFVKLGMFVSMTQYKDDFDFPVAFPPAQLKNGFGEYISHLGLKQLRIAETEKYAHVTFFFNGGEEQVFEHEDRILVPSPHVPTYDLKPEMSAFEVTDKLLGAINNRKYDAIICNFANADMVGHTGDFNAAVKAIETIDECLGKIVDATLKVGGELLITADHGNAEQMKSFITEKIKAQAHTAHTNNLVPLLYIGRPAEPIGGTGALCDIAPTLLHLMGLKQPPEMTGHTLFNVLDYPNQAIAGD